MKINTRHKIPSIAFSSLIVVSLVISATTLTTPFTKAATEPGYNGTIVFYSMRDGNYEIYSMEADGIGQTNLTNINGNDLSPQFSPDYSKIAYHGAGTGFDIYTINPDGSSRTALTNATGNDRFPMWSPDGGKIIFDSTRDSGNREVYIMDANGSNETRLTNAANPDYDARWSPDGSKIAFQSNRDGNSEIYVMNADGSNQTRLTNNSTGDTDPLWSPDGGKIAFSSRRDGTNEIYTMNADGSNQTRLTNTADRDEYVTDWSADGSTIIGSAYSISLDDSDLVIVQADGSGNTVEDLSSEGLAIVDDATWSPDNRSLLLTAYTDSDYTGNDMWLYSVADSGVERLTTDGSSGYGIWQPIPNTSPSIINDSSNVTFNTPTLVDVLANDTDEEGLSVSNLSISIQPTHGSAAIESGKVKYTPTTNYQGPDSLTYQICDSFTLDQLCAIGTLNLTVLAPTAPSLSVTNVNGEQYSPQTNQYTTSNLRPTFSGTATPGAEITVEIHSDPVILTTTADGNGNWSVTPAFDLPSGEHMVYISATLYGLTTELDAFGLSIGTLANTGASIWTALMSGIGTLGTGLFLVRFSYKKNLL